MNKEQIQSELFVSSKQSKIKTKLISFSLAVSNSTTKQNSFRKTSNLKFKTQKSSPEKTILKQNPKNDLNSPLNNLNDKKTINENDNSEKEILNVNEEFMKQKILKKKIESSNMKRANFLNFSNPFHNLSANNRITTVNNNNEYKQIKNHRINILPTNINYQKSSLINNSIYSPKLEDSKKITSFSSISYLSHQTGINSNSKPLTLTSSVIGHHNYKKSDILENKNLFIENDNNSKGKNNKNEFLHNNNKKINQTQPITNKNSRKNFNDKKSSSFIPAKNSILTGLITNSKKTNQNIINSKNILRNKVDEFFTSQSVNNLKSKRNYNKFFIQKNLLSNSSNNVNMKIKSRKTHSKAKTINNSSNKTLDKKKKNSNNSINHNNHFTHRNENLFFSKYLVKTSSSGNQRSNFSISLKDNLNIDLNKKNFIHIPKTSTHSVSKTIPQKTSITHLKDLNDNTNFLKKNYLSNKNGKQKSKKNKYIFNSDEISNKKTKSIFKEEEKKRKKNKNFNSNPIDPKIKDISFKSNLENTQNEINDNEKKELIQNGKYYQKLSDNLSEYIKQYYNKTNDYPKTTLSFYKFGRLIGRGAFGKVNLGLHVLSGKIVAIKSFNKKNFPNEKSKEKIYNEINLMKTLHHNSIVKILETLETENYILVIMENVSGGDLLSFVKKRTKLNEKISKFIFKQLINAIKYIHSKGIIHRDIKLDNILIDLNNNIKIGDFGIGKYFSKGEKIKDKCGTPAYIAPEILQNCPYEGPPVDIWSSGVVLYAMLNGTVPFKANNLKDLHKLILTGNYTNINNISYEAQDLLKKLLEIDPKKRISINNILNHPWLNYNGNKNNIDDGKIKLFTKAEIILLSKENVDYRICEKEEMLEHFTLKNLYTINDTINKDINTKSVILAPFNSTFENNNDGSNESRIYDNNLEIINNDVYFFCENAKILNRKYELNNNGEIDHGILINHSTKNKDHSNLMNELLNGSKNEDENSLDRKNSEFTKLDSKRNVSSLTDSSTLVIDEAVLKTMENFGYIRDDIQKFLINNELNYATATYFLLSNGNEIS